MTAEFRASSPANTCTIRRKAETGEMDAECYHFNDRAECGHHCDYILPAVMAILEKEQRSSGVERRVFDLGCGDGSATAYLARCGYEITGVDSSIDGIRTARKHHPGIRFERGSAYDRLADVYGTFPIVVSLEVIEHVYAPRDYARTLRDLIAPGGIAVISTPFHGYLKNVALAVSGRMDGHFGPLWDHGHIKFWSKATLRQLLVETGFEDVNFTCVGRVPFLAKSMIALARKPSGEDSASSIVPDPIQRPMP